ncbi:unnamed protein product, partial [Mesorhabditis spiculigera]
MHPALTLCLRAPRLYTTSFECGGGVEWSMRTTPWRHIWLLLGLIEAAVAVKCYYCTSMLNSDVEDDAKTAMKKLVYENYNLPPTHELCSLPDDIEFRIVPHCSKRSILGVIVPLEPATVVEKR